MSEQEDGMGKKRDFLKLFSHLKIYFKLFKVVFKLRSYHDIVVAITTHGFSFDLHLPKQKKI